MYDSTNVGHRIRQRRLALNMSQTELAGQLAKKGFPVWQSHLSMIERGQNMPSLPLFFAVAEVLQTTPNDLASLITP